MDVKYLFTVFAQSCLHRPNSCAAKCNFFMFSLPKKRQTYISRGNLIPPLLPNIVAHMRGA